MDKNAKLYKKKLEALNFLGYRDQEAAIKKAKALGKECKKKKLEGYTLFFQGEVAFYEGFQSKAKTLEKKAVKLLPDVHWIHSNLAVIYTVDGELKKALKSFDQALKLNGKDTHALCCKGVACSRLGLEDEAMDLFDMVIDLSKNKTKKTKKSQSFDPYLWQALVNKAVLLSNLGLPDEALDHFEKAVELDPDSTNVLNKKGVMLYNLDRKREALKQFDRALKLNPQNVQALRNKIVTLGTIKQFREGLLCLEKLEKIEPLNHTDLAWKTRMFVRSEQFEKAVEAAHTWKKILEESDLPTADADAILKRITTRKKKKKKR